MHQFYFKCCALQHKSLKGLLIAGVFFIANASASNFADIVDQQIDAYNVQDIDAFAATYASDIKIFDSKKGLIYSGREALAKHYGEKFSRLKCLQAVSLKRIVQGNHVVDHEWARSCSKDSANFDYEVKLIVVYTIESGLIKRVEFFRN